MKLTMEETPEFLCLPEDALIQVSVADISDREVAGRDGKDGWTSLSFKFTVIGLPSHLEAEYGVLIGQPIFGSTSARLTTNPDNKLRKWVEALLDIGELDAGFELDTEMLIGRKARAQIGNYVKNGQTQKQHKVVGLLPLAVAQESQPAFAGFSEEPPF